MTSLIHMQGHNDAPAASGTHFALIADKTYNYAREKRERRVLCKLQRGLTAVNSWCECLNIKINKRKTGDLFLQNTQSP
jgi:hypothetical protein